MRHRIDEKLVLLCMPKGGPDGPIAPYLHSFAQSLSEQGYSRRYLGRQVMLAACFSRWLKQKRVRSGGITSEHPSQYLRCRYRERQIVEGDAGVLDRLMVFLRSKRLVQERRKSSTPPPIPVERCARAYERYLRQDRALAEATIINYVPFIVDFLKGRSVPAL